jgi:3-isopropylmalate dehydrogenase
MLLRTSLGRSDAAEAIEAAVAQALADGWRTADLADAAHAADGPVVVGTTGFTTAVVEALEAMAGAGSPAAARVGAA